MIDADYAAINYVSGSHQLDRVLHKVVTFTVSARTETGVRLCLRVKCVRRKLCVQRLVQYPLYLSSHGSGEYEYTCGVAYGTA